MSEQPAPTDGGPGIEDPQQAPQDVPPPDAQAPERQGKSRPGYLDASGSESTRELRSTARRRRDAEEKLQQHLLEAKDHVPNEHRR